MDKTINSESINIKQAFREIRVKAVLKIVEKMLLRKKYEVLLKP
jgi:hypothetical protein